jgi:hypothetical protein
MILPTRCLWSECEIARARAYPFDEIPYRIDVDAVGASKITAQQGPSAGLGDATNELVQARLGVRPHSFEMWEVSAPHDVGDRTAVDQHRAVSV